MFCIIKNVLHVFYLKILKLLHIIPTNEPHFLVRPNQSPHRTEKYEWMLSSLWFISFSASKVVKMGFNRLFIVFEPHHGILCCVGFWVFLFLFPNPLFRNRSWETVGKESAKLFFCFFVERLTSFVTRDRGVKCILKTFLTALYISIYH